MRIVSQLLGESGHFFFSSINFNTKVGLDVGCNMYFIIIQRYDDPHKKKFIILRLSAGLESLTPPAGR